MSPKTGGIDDDSKFSMSDSESDVEMQTYVKPKSRKRSPDQQIDDSDASEASEKSRGSWSWLLSQE